MSDDWRRIIIENDWDSTLIIGNVRQRYDQLERKHWDWSSFYNGWIEGRISMLVELTKEEWREKHK